LSSKNFEDSPLLNELSKLIIQNGQTDWTYEQWTEVCHANGWIEINNQSDSWVESIQDSSKRDLIIAYNKLNQDLKWNTKKKEKTLFRKGDFVISYEKDLANWWEYQTLLDINKPI
jgi:hypothetical protein|tara:strand:- start:117 stop:464 length:348 start_codon:yes stop_codon:yes gene_type:complete